MSDDLNRTMHLIRRAQAGDAASLNSLLERYGDRLLRIVRLRLGKGLRRRLESADIVQETMLVAVRNFGDFVPHDEASLLNWLAAIAVNRIRDAADRHGADKRDVDRDVSLTPPSSSGSVQIEPRADGPTPQEHAARAELIEAVEAVMCELPAEQRELVIQREYLGRAWNDVAEHSGHPSGAAARMAYGKVLVELGQRLRGRHPGI